MEIKTGNVNEEKHVPYIQETTNGYSVSLGKPALHPMIEKHYIETIELFVDGVSQGVESLTADDQPKAIFKVAKGKKVHAIAHCNIHGTWKGEL